MGSNTHIYDRFKHYSFNDCSCVYCLHYVGKKQGCSAAVCCCPEEKITALMRENGLSREEAELLIQDIKDNGNTATLPMVA